MSRIIYVVPSYDGGVSPSFATEAEAEAYIEQTVPCDNKHEHFRYEAYDDQEWSSSVADTVYSLYTDGTWRIGHLLPADATTCDGAFSRGGYIAEVSIDD